MRPPTTLASAAMKPSRRGDKTRSVIAGSSRVRTMTAVKRLIDLAEAFDKVHEGLDPKAQSARFVIAPLTVFEHRTGDIQMSPGDAFGHELAQEQRRGDGARDPTGCDVVD